MGIISGYMPGVTDTGYLGHVLTQPGETAPPVDFSNLPGTMGDMNTGAGALAGIDKMAQSPSSYNYQGEGGPYFTGHGTDRVLNTIGADYGVTLPDNFSVGDYTAGRAGDYTVGEYSSLANQIGRGSGGDDVNMIGDVSAPALSNYLDGGGRETFNEAYTASAERRNEYLGGMSDWISEDQQHLTEYADEAGIVTGAIPLLPSEIIGPDGMQIITDRMDELHETGLPVDPRTGEPGVAYDPETGQPIEYDDGETPPGTPAGGTPYGFDENPEHTWISGHDTGTWDSAFERLEGAMPPGYYPDPPPEPRGQSPLAEVISGRGALPRNASTGGMGISMPEPTVPIGWSPGGVATSSGGSRRKYGETPYGQGGDFGLPV